MTKSSRAVLRNINRSSRLDVMFAKTILFDRSAKRIRFRFTRKNDNTFNNPIRRWSIFEWAVDVLPRLFFFRTIVRWKKNKSLVRFFFLLFKIGFIVFRCVNAHPPHTQKKKKKTVFIRINLNSDPQCVRAFCVYRMFLKRFFFFESKKFTNRLVPVRLNVWRSRVRARGTPDNPADSKKQRSAPVYNVT